MTVTAIGNEPKVFDAIAQASARTGVGFDYLVSTAKRESGLDCNAKSKTSSACGLYQFVAQTWLSTLKAHGAEHGLADVANDIRRDSSGQFSVASPARQQEILALRKDPKLAAGLAADLTADNAKVLAERIGRAPTDGELYAAHVLGAAGAAKLIGLAKSNPTDGAASFFSDAASRNQGLFYDKAGAPVSTSALLARLSGQVSTSGTTGGLRPSLGLDAQYPIITSAPGQSVAAAPLVVREPVRPALNAPLASLPLTLSPQVLAILTSLYVPLSGNEQNQSNDRHG